MQEKTNYSKNHYKLLQNVHYLRYYSY